MISQEQSVASISILTIITGFFLWSLVQTEGLQPYVTEGTPHIGNIILFLVLVSFLTAGMLTILSAVVITAWYSLRKVEKRLTGAVVGALYLTVFSLLLIALLLHVFHIIHFSFSMLSYGMFWGIVIYGRYKEKNKFKKYTSESNRGAKK